MANYHAPWRANWRDQKVQVTHISEVDDRAIIFVGDSEIPNEVPFHELTEIERNNELPNE